MRDAAFDPAAIAADTVALAELPGGTGHEQVRIDWPRRRLREALVLHEIAAPDAARD